MSITTKLGDEFLHIPKLVMCKGWANPQGSRVRVRRVRVRGFVKGQGVSRDFYSSNYKVLYCVYLLNLSLNIV